MGAPSVRAVLFDLDGVLIDSWEVWFRVLNAAAAEWGYAAISRETFAGAWGQGLAADQERFFPPPEPRGAGPPGCTATSWTTPNIC